MVKIRWKITDVITDVCLNEFNVEWNGIYGYFEICVNNKIVGFCPDRKLMVGEEGNENITHWLTKLLEGIIQLKADQEYEMQLLSMNLAKVVLERKNKKIIIHFFNSNEDELIWSEEIMADEWYDEIMLNVKKFIKEIEDVNPVLIKTEIIKRIINYKNFLDSNIFGGCYF